MNGEKAQHKMRDDYKFNKNSEVMGTFTTVKKKDLIKILKASRDKHKKEFEEAQKGYVITCREVLEERLVAVNAGDDFDMFFSDNVENPESHINDYQNVIDMLEIGSDKTIRIGVDDYKRYYKNEWGWNSRWALSNKAYVDKFNDR